MKYEVFSSCGKRIYVVDLNEFYCSCNDFNSNAFVCKHIFAMLIKYRIDYGEIIENIEKKEAYKFINVTRQLITIHSH